MSASLIALARGIAERAHAGQLDKVGAPYIEHPAMVAQLVQLLPECAAADDQYRTDAVCAAWLHDVIEDTDETAESLTTAGLPEDVVAAVVALTRTDALAPDDYYSAIRRQPLARLVKTADIASNLAPHRVAGLDEATRARLATKYAHALDQLGVDGSVIAALHAELDRAV